MARRVHFTWTMIGVFDSGIGGLTVLEALRRRLPRRDFVYLADTARLPYGNRSREEVRGFAREITYFLLGMEVEGIVVACNTASAAALPDLRGESPAPVWGMVDAGVEAVTRATATGRVAVLGTQATVASGVFQHKLEARGFRVWAQACPALVHAGEERAGDTGVLVRHYLREMPRVDALLLGCTHFALLRREMERAVGPGVKVVDGAEILAGRVAAAVEDDGRGSVRYFVTGDPERFAHALPCGERRPSVQQCALADSGRGIEIVPV